MKKQQAFILSIDAGTTGITVLVVDHHGQIRHRGYREITQFYPQPGWVEHNAMEIWEVTRQLMAEAFHVHHVKYCQAIGITNQRETTIVWDRKTGYPVYHAIVWQCRRTFGLCESLKNDGFGEQVFAKTGLIIDSYFSATKISWILGNVPGARQAADSGKLVFGTLDTWLIYKLTGDTCHQTDFTNASRTLLFNIHSKSWDAELMQIFDIPEVMLPEVQSSAGRFGTTATPLFGRSIPICGVAGDQQAALFGQLGFSPGSVKSTYGTGCFLLANTGETPVRSTNGLLTTLACGASGNPLYALEGSIFMGGAILQWMRDGLEILEDAQDSDKFASSVQNSGGVVLVPAFTGLGAPYWRSDIRGAILGLTRGTRRAHLVRAALESIAFQVYDLIHAIQTDLDYPITELFVDGGAVKNDFLMQFQADILNLPVNRPENIETTALGAGYLAGVGTGFWSSIEELRQCRVTNHIFFPAMTPVERSENVSRWKQAIAVVLGGTQIK